MPDRALISSGFGVGDCQSTAAADVPTAAVDIYGMCMWGGEEGEGVMCDSERCDKVECCGVICVSDRCDECHWKFDVC